MASRRSRPGRRTTATDDAGPALAALVAAALADLRDGDAVGDATWRVLLSRRADLTADQEARLLAALEAADARRRTRLGGGP